MTTDEWKVALEGDYTQIATPPAGGLQAKSSPADLDRLPLSTKLPKLRDLSREDEKKRKHRRTDTNSTGRKQIEKLSIRADINVRFGVHAGFGPYDPTSSHMWGSLQVSAKDVIDNERLWKEVVWELSVLNFRLELFAIDRELFRAGYAGGDRGAERSRLIIKIWSSKGWVVPPWTKSGMVDDLCEDDDGLRKAAVGRLANVMECWPGGESMARLRCGGSQFSDAEERETFAFYVNSAHPILHCVPTVPMQIPASLV